MRALRRASHTAKANPRAVYITFFDPNIKTPAYRRNILIKAF
jgi:hypothetical protein